MTFRGINDVSCVYHYCQHGPGYLADTDPRLSFASQPTSESARQKRDGKCTRMRDGVGKLALLRLIKPGGCHRHAYHCLLRHAVVHVADADRVDRITEHSAGHYRLNHNQSAHVRSGISPFCLTPPRTPPISFLNHCDAGLLSS